MTADAELTRLLRGTSSDHVETIRDAWRALLQIGVPAVPFVRAKLDSDAWSKAPIGPTGKYLGILLALLYELDRDVFVAEIKRLRDGRLHQFHRQTIDLLANRRGDAVVSKILGYIPVYISDEIENWNMIAALLDSWSRTPGLALDGITRIDVIARRSHLEYLGLYNLQFSGIILTWPDPQTRRFSAWFQRLSVEFTFYHEVGHHASGHFEGGTVDEQEREADTYAHARMRSAHPVLIFVARIMLAPFRPVLRRLSAKHRRPRNPL